MTNVHVLMEEYAFYMKIKSVQHTSRIACEPCSRVLFHSTSKHFWVQGKHVDRSLLVLFIANSHAASVII